MSSNESTPKILQPSDSGYYVYPSLQQMNALPRYISTLFPFLNKFGALCIVPPEQWVPPQCLVNDDTTILEMSQSFPQPPMADRSISRECDRNQDDQGRICSDIMFGERRKTTVSRFKKRNKKSVKELECDDLLDDISIHGWDGDTLDKIEDVFWKLFRSGNSGKIFKVYYGNDVRVQELNDYNVTETTASSKDVSPKPGLTKTDSRSSWSSANINEGGTLQFCNTIPGVNNSFYYVGSPFSYFGLHCEDVDLFSLAYLHSGSPKFWYVYKPSLKKEIENFLSKTMFSPEYINQNRGGVRQILQKKFMLLDPSRMKSHGANFRPFTLTQKKGTFVLTAPRSYHFGFNTGFNVAETSNYADANWLRFGRSASKVPASYRTDGSVSLPWELLCWKELEKYNQLFSSSESTITTQDIKNSYKACTELSIYIRKAEKIISHRHNMKDGCIYDYENFNIPGWTENSLEILCDICEQPTYLYVEICKSCRTGDLARCIYHVSNGPYHLCKVSGHSSAIVRRYSNSYISSKIIFLRSILDSIKNSEKESSKQNEEGTDNTNDSRKKKRLSRYERRKKNKVMKLEK